MPTVIFAGEADKIVKPDDNARKLHAELENSVLHVIPDVGHMLHHAVPAEVVAGFVSDERKEARSAPETESAT